MLSNTHIAVIKPLVSPRELIRTFPPSPEDGAFVESSRATVEDILHGKDPRFLVIVGPCSIHDYDAALDYARRLVQMRDSFPNLFLVMRVYFEKPRTRKGWKGFLYDPDIDESFLIDKGLALARKLLLQLTQLRVPIGTEFLDTITPQYLADLVSWGAIGARTSESQIHRQLASGLSMPIGFKNLTSGDYEKAIDGILAANHGQNFFGVDDKGVASHVRTEGNPHTHLILRGGTEPNYKEETLAGVTRMLKQESIHTGILIDCSHGNSQKEYMRQILVALYVHRLFVQGTYPIRGIMLESHLHKGKQSKPEQYGVSITDACIDVDTTATLFQWLHSFDSVTCANLSELRVLIQTADEQIFHCLHGEPYVGMSPIASKYHFEEDAKVYEICRGYEPTEALLMLVSTRLSFANRLAELLFANLSLDTLQTVPIDQILGEEGTWESHPLFPAILECSKSIQIRCLEQRIQRLRGVFGGMNPIA